VKEKQTTVKYNYEHFVQYMYLKVTAWQIAFAHQSAEGIDGI